MADDDSSNKDTSSNKSTDYDPENDPLFFDVDDPLHPTDSPVSTPSSISNPSPPIAPITPSSPTLPISSSPTTADKRTGIVMRLTGLIITRRMELLDAKTLMAQTQTATAEKVHL